MKWLSLFLDCRPLTFLKTAILGHRAKWKLMVVVSIFSCCFEYIPLLPFLALNPHLLCKLVSKMLCTKMQMVWLNELITGALPVTTVWNQTVCHSIVVVLLIVLLKFHKNIIYLKYNYFKFSNFSEMNSKMLF